MNIYSFERDEIYSCKISLHRLSKIENHHTGEKKNKNEYRARLISIELKKIKSCGNFGNDAFKVGGIWKDF